jgi:Protein of unknown function (DUF1570)
MRIFRLPLVALAAALSCLVVAARADNPSRFMIEATVHGDHLEGAPLTWSEQRVFLLARDGRLWDFAPQDATNFRKTASYFSPYTARELTGTLQAELGRRVEVTATAHYLVAHPIGQGEYWSDRFEQMYRQFIHYFGVRGISLRQPEVPLVAIVFTRHDDFLRYAMADGNRPVPGLLGYYSTRTNRVALFDIGEGRSNNAGWQQNGFTIVHESAHQLAFNLGVHNRFAPVPQWLAEGLGTLFEARGVWNSEDYRDLKDRINRQRLAEFKQYVATRRRGDSLPRLIASDRQFSDDVGAAYSESWALTLFLVETQPRAYSDYLKKTAARPSFQPYTTTKRTADFVSAFGDDWRMLDARLLRFINELP